ncbi:MAG: DUF3017 domain-containing protein [Streptosporangiaceae bacterium]|jgi:hypothetical protein
MANMPANAGSSSGQTPLSAAQITPASSVTPARQVTPAARSTPAPRGVPGHRAVRPRNPKTPRAQQSQTTPAARPNALSWLLYLLVLAGVAAGLVIACEGPRSAGRGAGVVGCSLLAAGLARLVLPPRYASLLATRRKASDVLAFAVLGAGVLGVALLLP